MRVNIEDRHCEAIAEEGFLDFHARNHSEVIQSLEKYYVKPFSVGKKVGAYDKDSAQMVREAIWNNGAFLEHMGIYHTDLNGNHGTLYYEYQTERPDEATPAEDVGTFHIRTGGQYGTTPVLTFVPDDWSAEEKRTKKEINLGAVEVTPGGLVNFPAAIAEFMESWPSYE